MLGAAVFFACANLSACTPAPLPTPAPFVITLDPMPSAHAIRRAEAFGYDQGLADGKRIQAAHDQSALAGAVTAAKAIRRHPAPGPAIARPGPTASTPPPAPPANVFIPGGPAVPVTGVQ